MTKYRRITIVILICACITVMLFCGVSFSRFVLQADDTIQGGYTAFLLSNNGDGQSAVFQGTPGNYSAFVDVAISNFEGDKTSVRDVSFKLRSPSSSEIGNGYIDDGWGGRIDLVQKSNQYAVSIVDLGGAEHTDYIVLEGNKFSTKSLIVKIEFAGNIEGVFTDVVNVVIETNEPYIVRQVFTINVTNSLVSFGLSKGDYFGFEQTKVTVKTSADFSAVDDMEGVVDVNYLTSLSFATIGADFDIARFIRMYPDLTVSETDGTVIISDIKPGSEVSLFFYPGSGAKVTVEVKIDGVVYSKVAGLGTMTDGRYTVFQY